jgi:hypothetical protein
VRAAGESIDVEGLRVVAVDAVADLAQEHKLGAPGGVIVGHRASVSGNVVCSAEGGREGE